MSKLEPSYVAGFVDGEEIEKREGYYLRLKELNARKPVTTTKGSLSEAVV